MKTLLCLCVALGMALGAARVRAADVTGSWTGEFAAPDGSSFQIQFTFKQAGTTLAGSVLGPQGDSIAISDGKIDGNKLSFRVSVHGITILHEGTVSESGDEIRLSTKSDSGDFPASDMTLRRLKTEPPVDAAATSPQ